MKRWILLLLFFGCAGSAAGARPRRAVQPVDYCPMVLQTVNGLLGPFTDDYTTLEEQCVREVATTGGITYAEAVGFDPMPSQTITCDDHGWIVRIGQHPPPAPTTGVLLIGFERVRHGARKFSARVERSGWRAAPNRIAVNGCGTVDGTVELRDGQWVVKVIPQKL